jgi:hypothetical protein
VERFVAWSAFKPSQGVIRFFFEAGMALKATIFKVDLQVADLDR